jgi:hypothetical protein
MNHKITVISLVTLSSLLLAGCTKIGTPTAQTPTGTNSEAIQFADAIKSGKPAVCTLSKDDDKMEYLISGKKMRINATNLSKDDKGGAKTTVSHVINDTAYMYTWSDSTKQGSKISVPTEEEMKATADKAKSYQASSAPAPKLDSEADYQGFKDQGYAIDCKSGSVDDSVFTPPADIKFIDPTEMMKQVTGGAAAIDYKKLQEQYSNNY